MSFDAQRLYKLLPAIYQIRDAERGEPLNALIKAIAQQVAVLEEDLAQLYDDQFIETCADWVVPYIGDLIGYRPLHGIVPQISSPRAEVANTIGYRRRKGTAAMLEQLARDVTGWDAAVVEFFQRLATTQYMNHLRPENLYTPDLRRWQSLERLNTAFDSVTHTIDVRRIASQRGRYNIPNIGIFLWRLKSYFVPHKVIKDKASTDPYLTTARTIPGRPGRYTFNPVGLDAPLFNPPIAETEFTHLAEPRNVPEPLRRRELYEELETRRQASVDGETPPKVYFDENSDYQAFQIVADQALIPPEEILICNLSNWQPPPASKNYQPWQRPPSGKDYRRKPLESGQSSQPRPIQVAVDSVLGRMVFRQNPKSVEVTYAYGFSMDMGGGIYDRSRSISSFLQTVTWQRGVTRTLPGVPGQLVRTLATAIENWNNQATTGTVGTIVIMDSRTYQERLPQIQLPAGSQLAIVAADWQEVDDPSTLGQKQRLPGKGVNPDLLRPHILGNLSVKGKAAKDPQNPESTKPGQLILNGLLIEGKLTVRDGNLGSLQVIHCTLVPAKGGLTVAAANNQLSISLERSICGSITLPETVSKLQVIDSIVDAGEKEAIAAPGTETTIQTSTIFGSSNFRSLEASNSIFTGRVVASLRQIGCVRFSSLATESLVARRYRCQPDLALAQRVKELGLSSDNDLSDAERESIRSRITPQFTSVLYGDPGYGQLSQRCAVEIRQGAEDEVEMGAFHDLYQPQRETNLRVRLDEYLRFGLEAGIFYVT